MLDGWWRKYRQPDLLLFNKTTHHSSIPIFRYFLYSSNWECLELLTTNYQTLQCFCTMKITAFNFVDFQFRYRTENRIQTWVSWRKSSICISLVVMFESVTISARLPQRRKIYFPCQSLQGLGLNHVPRLIELSPSFKWTKLSSVQKVLILAQSFHVTCGWEVRAFACTAKLYPVVLYFLCYSSYS
jgi:hypothetical protein